MKKRYSFLILLFLFGCAHAPAKQDAVFQNAPIHALLAGCYTGTMTVQELEKRGDFGLGTLDALDGEMVVLDRIFYQIKPDGKAYRLGDEATSPFATVTFFKKEQEFSPGEALSYKDLTQFLDERLLSPNLFYAVKVEGRFKMLKARSAPRQNKPYPVLTEAIKDQKVFEWGNLEGTLVGFRVPPYMEGINVPGYHFHFLSKDRTIGGHVIDFQVEESRMEVSEGRKFMMELPGNEEFLKFRFEADTREAITAVEK